VLAFSKRLVLNLDRKAGRQKERKRGRKQEKNR
jgi:hypothetical protein